MRQVVNEATGDGRCAMFSLVEIDPAFGNQKDVVAYADQAGRLGTSDGALRIVVPGDIAGDRHVSNPTSLQVIHVAPGHLPV